ncbi:MAG: homoserine dehydrogenase [Acidimicrobiaceae bacterium]|nr:homoserine dehydrogenase [Acidimicrobiaceae bacterium]
MSSIPVRLGILGCGNVGAALVKIIVEDQGLIESQTGEVLEIAAIAVRDLSIERPGWVSRNLLTDDPFKLVNDPSIDIIVEVMGGYDPARVLIEEALRSKKSVVTANKTLLSDFGEEISQLARSQGRDVFFEAAVAGGIPLIRSLKVSLAAERVRRVTGIVNGTTNYILTRMSEDGIPYGEALRNAQELGYAEADPTADVEGIDASAKAAILASIAFGRKVRFSDVSREGITSVTLDDFEFAKRHGYTLKLLAICEWLESDEGSEGDISVRVHPAMVPLTHPLASVRDAFNAVFVEGDSVGELMFYGRGAGGMPTASAVLGDVIDAAHNIRYGSIERHVDRPQARILAIDELQYQFYIAIDVSDRPGVLAQVATVFGANGVSIMSMEQVGLGQEARLIFITHQAKEHAVQKTLAEVRELAAAKRLVGFIRVLGKIDN